MEVVEQQQGFKDVVVDVDETPNTDTKPPLEVSKPADSVGVDEDIGIENLEPKDTDDAETVILKDAEEPETELKSTKSKPITITEGEDDIIVLDDDDEEETTSGGLSESKRPRKEVDDDVMEVDDTQIVSREERETAGKIIRKMGRQDLEDLVLAKIVEAIVAHTEVGQLRAKVLELQILKDKMASKMGIMMKQVAELSSAIQVISENEMRDPKNRLVKPHMIRFNRSVGLQTSIEPGVRSAPARIIRVQEQIIQNTNANGVKHYGPSGNKGAVFAGGNASFNTSQPQPVKRVYQGNKNALGENKPIPTPSQRKVYSPAVPSRVYPIAPKPSTMQTATATPTSQPGVVDLTDDDPVPSTTVTSTSATPPPSTVPSATIINGTQYQIIQSNRSTTLPSGVQIVSPQATGQKYIVTSASGQVRPILVPQLAVGTGSQQLAGNQSIMLRGVNNTTPVTIIQRPVAPRAPSNGNNARVAATIPVRPGGGSLLGTANAAPKRFVLPPLPATPAPKGRNDSYKPPPKPELTLNEQADGIVLSWNLSDLTNIAEVTTYQIFACQESLTANNSTRPSQWKRVGDVKALPLPMACTLSQFTEENRYYFIVRGIDVFGRVGPFCDPQNILLRRKK